MTSTTGGLRKVVAVVLAADSPAGRIGIAIDDVTAHLPAPVESRMCPLCSAQSWPCSRFDGAASRVLASGVRLADLVPLDLHPRLWPRPPGTQPPVAPVPNQPNDHSSTWFDKESDDG